MAKTRAILNSENIGTLEAGFVFIALTLIACCSGGNTTDWTSAAAVFLGFLYSQMSFDLADRERRADLSPQARRLRSVFMLKELGWILTFVLLGSWPLVFGAAMFLAYPQIRSFVRR